MLCCLSFNVFVCALLNQATFCYALLCIVTLLLLFHLSYAVLVTVCKGVLHCLLMLHCFMWCYIVLRGVTLCYAVFYCQGIHQSVQFTRLWLLLKTILFPISLLATVWFLWRMRGVTKVERRGTSILEK